MKTRNLLGATAAAFGFVTISCGNPIPSLGDVTAFEGEVYMELGELAPTNEIVQFVDSDGGELVCRAFAWTAEFFQRDLTDFVPVGETGVVDRVIDALDTDDGGNGTVDTDGGGGRGTVDVVSYGFDSDGTNDKADEGDGLADSSAVIAVLGEGDDGSVVEISPADLAAWAFSTTAAEANSNDGTDCSIDDGGDDGTVDVVSYGIVPSSTDGNASSSQDLQEGQGDVENNDFKNTASATEGDCVMSFTADNASNTMSLTADIVDECDEGSDNGPFDSDVTDDKVDEDDGLADSSAVFGSFGDGDDGSVVEVSLADRAAWTLSTNATEDNANDDNNGSDDDKFTTDGTSTSDPTRTQTFTGEAGVIVREDTGDTTSTSSSSDLAEFIATPELSDSMTLRADIVDGYDDGSDKDHFRSDVTNDKAGENYGLADSSAVGGSFGDGDDGSLVEVSTAGRAAWTLSTNADNSNDDNNGGNNDKFTTDGTSTSDPTRTQTFTGEAGVIAREDTGDTTSTSSSSDLAEFIATPELSDSMTLRADIVDGCDDGSDKDHFHSDVTDDKAGEDYGLADSSAVGGSSGDGDNGSLVEVSAAGRAAWTLSTNADNSNDDNNGGNNYKFTTDGTSTSDPTRTQTFTGEAGVIVREDAGDTTFTSTSSDLAEFTATPGLPDNDHELADDVAATELLAGGINVDGENSIDIGRMEMETSANDGIDSSSSGASTSTSTISTHNRRPTIPFLPSMQARSSTRRTIMKVGEVLTRLESLQSTDGSTTLLLGSDASMLMKLSPVCPLGTYADPTPSPAQLQCPVPFVAKGEGSGIKDENASVLLPASPWKLRRAAKKAARKLERKDRSGVTEAGKTQKNGRVRKFLGFFGHRGIDEGVSASAGQSGRKEDIENISPESTSATPATVVDEGDSAVPEQEKTRTDHVVDSAGKGRRRAGRGWFNWRSGNKRRQLDAKVDGEVEMTVSNIGGVEVTYDGAKVLSKSGPCDWEWVNRASRVLRGRKISDDYELRVVEEGVDMCLGERKVWGMRLPSSCVPSDES